MIRALYQNRTHHDPEADVLLTRFRNAGYVSLQKLIVERVFRLEGVDEQEALKLSPMFCHPVHETLSLSSRLQEKDGPVIEVGYQRAVTDPELDSIMRGARALGVSTLKWVRISHRYQFTGVDPATARDIVHRYLHNPQVQAILSPDAPWDTLMPRGQAAPVETISLHSLDDEGLVKLSDERRLFLSAGQMRELQKISEELGRPFYDAELEMFAQTWSDHCFHTTWKSLGLLQALWNATREIRHPLVLSVFEDNAGAMAFYDGWALTLKGETHNSPSAVSPYGGIMTKHGGVIRDTLGCGQGAWPIGGSTLMGLGNPRLDWSDVPEGALHPRTLLLESIRGTADYTNPMGIPMMFPLYRFHPGYTGKCFALGHSIGIIPSSRARKGQPRPGDIAVLIGGLTGRDGLHGATVSSSSMTSETATVDAAHVQIGHPIQERKFMEVIPVLRDSDCLRAITDLGAAGLSSAAGEMGAGTGIWINLAWVPLKTRGMSPWEIWISESQERMLLCVPESKCSACFTLLERFEVPYSRIGVFTKTGRCQVIFDDSLKQAPPFSLESPPLTGSPVVDLAFHALRKRCPLPAVEVKPPSPRREESLPNPLKTPAEWISAVHAVLGHLDLCDQSHAGTQFDSTIQGLTVSGPYGGRSHRMPSDIWAVAPVRGKPYGAVASASFNPRYGDIDPPGMARLMMLDAIGTLVLSGVSPAEIVLCDNFYTPRLSPETAYHLKEMVLACCSLSKKLKIPFISGKDSSSGTFIGKGGKRIDIPPTLAVMALGRMPDIRRLVTKPWKKPGSLLFLAGPVSLELGGSVYYDTLGIRGSRLPDPDPDAVSCFWKSLSILEKKGLILSASALSAGGLVRRLFEAALGGGMGCRLDLADALHRLGAPSLESLLFAESIGAVLLEVEPSSRKKLEKETKALLLGSVAASPLLCIETGAAALELPMEKLETVWERPFREVM